MNRPTPDQRRNAKARPGGINVLQIARIWQIGQLEFAVANFDNEWATTEVYGSAGAAAEGAKELGFAEIIFAEA